MPQHTMLRTGIAERIGVFFQGTKYAIPPLKHLQTDSLRCTKYRTLQPSKRIFTDVSQQTTL